MGDSLKGKVAVVTGSSKNIGKAIAIEMAREGARVVTNGRSASSAEGTADQVAREINDQGGTAIAVNANVATMEGGKKVIDACLERFGTIDILVNNAGYGASALVDQMTGQQWQEIIDVCLTGQFTCTRHAVPVMKAKGSGRIINISSQVGVNGGFGMSSYAAAKAGSIGLSIALARELKQHGITVNCVMPTATTPRTEQSRRFRAAQTGIYYPPNRANLPERIAPIVIYLASEKGAKVTGQLFHAAAGEITLFHVCEQWKAIHTQGGWTQEDLGAMFPATFGTELDLAPLPPPP